MRFLVIFLVLFLSSCSTEDIIDSEFSCSVDYIEFTSSTNAIVKFDVSHMGESASYFVDAAYVTNGNDYYIGDSLVNILGFSSKGSSATFDFEYGSSLGPFCMELFEAIPMHSHDAFAATAERSDTSKGVGRWKITKKSKIDRVNINEGNSLHSEEIRGK